VGTNPASVAVGDFNGDGKLDLAVANSASNNVSVLLGNGDGTFQAAVNYAVGTNPASVAVGDLNGDGKLDLAVANIGSNNVSVLLGNGDGTFKAAVNYAVGSSPYSVAVGDFNGDGKLDLAVANPGSNNVSVLLGNGDGTFQTAVNYAVGSYPYSVAVGDFDGDGRMDLAVANHGSNNVSILLQSAPTGGSAQLVGGNAFIGNQTVNGTVTATSFVGVGSGLTGVNAATVANGVYTTGSYADPSWITALSGGKITGTVASAAAAATATNATALGGVAAGNYARLDIGNSFTGNQSVAGNLGLGTTTPSQRLDLNGNLLLESMYPGGTYKITVSNGDSTAGSGGLLIKSSQTTTAGFRLLPYGSDAWFQNTNSGGWIYFAGLNGATLTGNIIFKSTGNVGIGTTTPGAKLTVTGGDVATTTAGSGLIVKSPDGTKCARIGIDNTGALVAASVTCP
jgi:hypothetical protein